MEESRTKPAMSRAVSDQLDQLLEGWPGSGRYRWSDGFSPLADLEETDDAYLVEVELPGVKKHDVAVEISGRRVIVDGGRKELERAGVLRRRTRAVGRFHHEVVLPGDVDAEAVSASLRPPAPAFGRAPDQDVLAWTDGRRVAEVCKFGTDPRSLEIATDVVSFKLSC